MQPSAGNKIESALQDVNYFARSILPKAHSAAVISDSKLNSLFEWAAHVKNVIKKNSALRAVLESNWNDDLDVFGVRHLAEAPKTLYLQLLDNPRLSKESMLLASRCLEKDMGYVDCDVRISREQRNLLRKTVVGASKAVRNSPRWTKCLQLQVADAGGGGREHLWDFSLMESVMLLATAVRLPKALTGGNWVLRVMALFVADAEHEAIVKHCLSASNGGDGALLLKGLDESKEFTVAVLRHCSSCADKEDARNLATWMVVNCRNARTVFKESDVALNYVRSKLKKILSES
jgi:hypothetical protein